MDFSDLVKAKSLYDAETDSQGGEKPNVNSQSLQEVDFITYPKGIEGSNCGNCRFNENGICQYPEIKGQKVNKHNCCGKWDRDGTLRLWAREIETKALSAMSETSGGALVKPAGFAKDILEARRRRKK